MDVSLHARTQRPLTVTVLIGLLLALTGCASTTLIARRVDPAFHGPPLHKVLVGGLQPDEADRRAWENSMVAALTRRGVLAIPSFQIFPERVPSEAELAATAARDGFDGVIATHVVGATAQPYWMSGSPGIGFGWRWRSFGYWDATVGPGYVESEDQSDYQTDIFTTGPNGGKLIWTGITRSLDLSSVQSATDEISRALVPALEHAGVLTGAAA